MSATCRESRGRTRAGVVLQGDRPFEMSGALAAYLALGFGGCAALAVRISSIAAATLRIAALTSRTGALRFMFANCLRTYSSATFFTSGAMMTSLVVHQW